MVMMASSALASPQEVIGFGPRSIAMGTTGAAVGRGVDTVYANPALLSLSRELELELGLEGAWFDLHAHGPGMPGGVGKAPLRANTLGALLPLPFAGVLKDRITVGLGFVTPLDVVVRGRILYAERPQFLLADRVQSIAVQAGLGGDIGHGLRLGVGVTALAALSGSVSVQTDASGRIGTLVEDTLVASYAPLLGLSWEFADGRYRAGLAVKGELVGRFNVVITAENLGSITIPPLNISGVAQYDPWQIALEFARILGPWRAAIGATYKHWPAYPGPLEATVRCEDAADPSRSCLAPTPPDPDSRPVVAPRIGVERTIELRRQAEFALRAGYAFEPSPAPEQTAAQNYFDNHRSVLGAGFGIRLTNAPLRFDGFAQVQALHARHHEKHVTLGAPVEGTVATSGVIVALGIAATARL
jgi:long-chain fatty acid transport protein